MLRVRICHIKAICAVSSTKDTIVPIPNFGCRTRSPREKLLTSLVVFSRFCPGLKPKLLPDIFPIEVEDENILLAVILKPFHLSSLYSSGISAINRETGLALYVPKLYRSFARVIISVFLARVMATYHSRRSSSNWS